MSFNQPDTRQFLVSGIRPDIWEVKSGIRPDTEKIKKAGLSDRMFGRIIRPGHHSVIPSFKYF
jgi:hypothetical protein